MVRLNSGSVFALALGFGAVVGLALPAHAASTQTVLDTYWGGKTNYPSLDGDVLENAGVHAYETSKVDVTRTSVDSGQHADLTITIHTTYAAAYNLGTATGPDGTGFGSLFLGPQMASIPSGAASKNDTFTGNTSRFSYAATMPTNTNSATGTGGLYALNGTGSDVQTAYWPNTNNTTSPSNGGVFRGGQAVQYIGSTANSLANVSWSINQAGGIGNYGQPGFDPTITFVISDEDNLLGQNFVLAWAMTCGNDTFLANFDIDITHLNVPPPPVPLPGTLALMGSVLFGAGGIGKWRKMRARKAA